MYTIKKITLKNYGIQRTRRVITFTDEAMTIIAEFLMTDANINDHEVLTRFQAVLNGAEKTASFTGNRCHVTINADKTTVTDIFIQLPEKEQYQPYTMNTEKLYNLTKNWLENKL